MRLFWKVYLLSLCSVLFCTVLITAIMSYRQAKSSLAHMRAEQRLLAETAASQVETGYYDQVWPFEMLSRIAKEPHFVAWQIVDGTGVVVMSSTSTEAGQQLARGAPDKPQLLEDSADRELWIIPMRMRNEASSWQFRLGYHTDAIHAQLRTIVLTNALIGLGLAILFIGTSLYVTHRVLRPLNLLTHAASEVGRGRLDTPLPRGGSDEIGQLVAGFSAMVESVKDRDAKIMVHLESLEAARASLEMRVAMRTQELHASETRTRAIIEYAADAIVTLDARGVVEVFNPAAARIFGYTQEEAVGRRFAVMLPATYALRLDELAIESTESGTAIALGSEGEICGLRRDGTTFPMHVALSEVSIDGARLVTAIVRDISERRRAEAEKQDLHERLVTASRQAGMAEIASNVLHNVGNVLNSVNVSATIVSDRLTRSKMPALSKVTALLREHAHDLGTFLTADKRGKLLPSYLEQLGEGLVQERGVLLDELASLRRDIDDIKEIVKAQQSHARVSIDVRALVDPRDIMEDAIRISGTAIEGSTVELVREYAAVRSLKLDRHKIVHILVNLLNNAKQAVAKTGRIRLCMATDDAALRVEVIDDGVGISPENLIKIFNHGFTTRPDGHGFGLHAAAIAAKEMGGSLTVDSEGVGRGARFCLTVPVAGDRAAA
ncbi:MAG TPA: PAS domain S-box protein [Kofleriaceae bacterium]